MASIRVSTPPFTGTRPSAGPINASPTTPVFYVSLVEDETYARTCQQGPYYSFVWLCDVEVRVPLMPYTL